MNSAWDTEIEGKIKLRVFPNGMGGGSQGQCRHEASEDRGATGAPNDRLIARSTIADLRRGQQGSTGEF
jgi:hypothetical protein